MKQEREKEELVDVYVTCVHEERGGGVWEGRRSFVFLSLF